MKVSKMKKLFKLLALILCCALLSSCSALFPGEGKVENEKLIDELFEAVKYDSVSSLSKLFSQKVRGKCNDLTEKAEEMLEFIEGDPKKITTVTGGYSVANGESEYLRSVRTSCLLETSAGVYRIAALIVLEDTDEAVLGIESLSVSAVGGSDVYWGDGIERIGITIDRRSADEIDADRVLCRMISILADDKAEENSGHAADMFSSELDREVILRGIEPVMNELSGSLEAYERIGVTEVIKTDAGDVTLKTVYYAEIGGRGYFINAVLCSHAPLVQDRYFKYFGIAPCGDKNDTAPSWLSNAEGIELILKAEPDFE